MNESTRASHRRHQLCVLGCPHVRLEEALHIATAMTVTRRDGLECHPRRPEVVRIAPAGSARDVDGVLQASLVNRRDRQRDQVRPGRHRYRETGQRPGVLLRARS